VVVDDAAIAIDGDGRGGVVLEQRAGGELADGRPRQDGAGIGERGVERRRVYPGQREIDRSMAGGPDPAEDAGLLVDRLEELLAAARRLAGAQEEGSSFAQTEVQQGEDAQLEIRLEVDQEVAAADDVEAAEGGILQDVLGREDHPLAELLAHPVDRVLFLEKALQPFRDDLRFDPAGVDAVAGVLQGALGGVGGEDLDVQRLGDPLRFLHQQHRERIRLFAARARGHPGADRRVGLAGADQRDDHALAQDLPRVGVAEEAGDVDQEVVGEVGDLGGRLAKHAGVVAQLGHPGEPHPALDAAQQGGLLVAAEVVAGARAQHGQDFADVLLVALRGGLGGAGVVAGVGMAGVGEQHLRHVARAENVVGVARVDQVARHRGEGRGFGVLGDAQPAHGLDRLGAGGTVAAHARQDDGDRALALLLGERLEEVVDRPVVHRFGQPLAEAEAAVLQRQRAAWPYHVEVVGLERHPFLDVHHRHRGLGREDVDQQRLAVRRQVLDEHEADAALGAHGRKELDRRFEPARRCADADHREGELRGLLMVHRLRLAIVLLGGLRAGGRRAPRGFRRAGVQDL
jgi:hypothetical protein